MLSMGLFIIVGIILGILLLVAAVVVGIVFLVIYLNKPNKKNDIIEVETVEENKDESKE